MSSPKKLLIIDDDSQLVRLLEEISSNAGFDAMGIENTSKLGNGLLFKEDWCGIVLDIVMPDIDGIEILRILSEQNSKTPVVIMSGYDGAYLDTAVNLGLEMGLNICGKLTKPFSTSALVTVLDKLKIN